jgi:hypothetical protein
MIYNFVFGRCDTDLNQLITPETVSDALVRANIMLSKH